MNGGKERKEKEGDLPVLRTETAGRRRAGCGVLLRMRDWGAQGGKRRERQGIDKGRDWEGDGRWKSIEPQSPALFARFAARRTLSASPTTAGRGTAEDTEPATASHFRPFPATPLSALLPSCPLALLPSALWLHSESGWDDRCGVDDECECECECESRRVEQGRFNTSHI